MPLDLNDAGPQPTEEELRNLDDEGQPLTEKQKIARAWLRMERAKSIDEVFVETSRAIKH